MDRVRGGVFSGAMVLAGLSATLISALIAIGIRQVTHVATRPTPVYVQPASGEVAVPDATPSATPAVKRSAVSHVPTSLRSAAVPVRHRTASTGSVSSGASVAPTTTSQQPATASQQPATASQQPATSSGSGTSSSGTTSPSSPSSSPSPSPSASAKGNGNGAGGANGNGGAGGNGGGNGHHP